MDNGEIWIVMEFALTEAHEPDELLSTTLYHTEASARRMAACLKGPERRIECRKQFVNE